MGIINKLFTEDQINIIKDMNNLRELQETLNKWGLKYRTIIGSKKPNRYRFAYSGYMIKVALDDSGKRDNLKEYEISGSLYPLVVKCYECSADGSIAVFELVDGVWICTPFFCLHNNDDTLLIRTNVKTDGQMNIIGDNIIISNSSKKISGF